MLSRALSLATVMLLIGAFEAAPAWAQATNLEAGKSPSQIFAGTCTACHKGPRGLLKTVAPGSLAGFLRQHYTTSAEMASLLSSYLVSNGATDTRYIGAQPKPGEKQEANKPGAPPEQLDRFGRRLRPAAPPQEAARPEPAKPDADGLSPQAEPGRAAKRLARPGEPPEAAKPAAEGQVPAQAAIERGPDGRKLTAKQKLGRHAKPGAEEPPKADAVREEPAKGEPEKEDKPKSETPKSETAKIESGKPEGAKPDNAKPEGTSPAANSPSGEGKPEAKIEAPKIEAPKDTGAAEKPALRADPVPPVTPAPPVAPAPASARTEPAPAARPSAPAAAEPAPPAVTASAPPPAPPAAAGPPAPPISQ
jgi:hypothetical protein